jgi:hypothetical protein
MKLIPLSQGMFTQVDDDIFDYLNQWKWCVLKGKNNYYAQRTIRINGKRKSLLLHRAIMNISSIFEIDHIDGNGLNNQRVNLRACNHKQNSRNRHKHKGVSIYKGVSFIKNRNAYSSEMYFNNKHIYLGYFKIEEDAAKAYDVKARELFGEFANLNFI